MSNVFVVCQVLRLSLPMNANQPGQSHLLTCHLAEGAWGRKHKLSQAADREPVWGPTGPIEKI